MHQGDLRAAAIAAALFEWAEREEKWLISPERSRQRQKKRETWAEREEKRTISPGRSRQRLEKKIFLINQNNIELHYLYSDYIIEISN